MTLDGSLTMFAKLPGLQEPNGSSSKTLAEYLPQTTEKLLPESVQRWHTTVSADGSGLLFQRQQPKHHTQGKDGFVLLPTPTSVQGRSLTSGMATGTGRKPGSTGHLRVNLNDLIFLDRLLNDMNQQLEDGKKLSADQLLTHIKSTGSITGLLSG